MGNSSQTSKLEPLVEEIRGLASTMTRVQVAARYGVGEASVRRLDRKHRIWANATRPVEPGAQTIGSDDPAEWGDVQGLLARRGLKTDDWLITGARVNEWADQRQLRVDLKPRLGLLMPARSDGWRPAPRPRLDKTKPQRVLLVPDIHAPHHDPVAIQAITAWLAEHQPERAVIVGDLLDLDAVSRYRKNPRWGRDIGETIQAAYDILRGFIEASPATHWEMIDGNHEDRMRNAILDHLPALHGVHRAVPPGETPEPAIHTAEFLMRFDELGITKVDLGGDDYTHAQVKLAPDLAVRHGWIARSGSGASALETLKRLRHSVAVAHTHRLGMVWFTTHDIDKAPITVRALECGYLGKLQGGLGHVPEPDWQQGAGVATIYPDGWFNLEAAPIVDGTLMYRDWRCNPVAA